MSRYFLLLAVVLSGCKTAEVAVSHPMSGVQVVAKFESFEPSTYQTDMAPAASNPRDSVAIWEVEPIIVR